MKLNILIISATRMEIAPLLDFSHNRSETISYSGRTIIKNRYKGHNYDILLTGAGTVNTAQALTSQLEKHRPDIIVQTGMAGIFSETGLKIGDIAIAESEHYIHTGVEKKQSYPSTLYPLPFDLISGNPLTKKGIFPVHPVLSYLGFKIICDHFSQKKIQVSKGPFITVSTITSSSITAKKLFSFFCPCMENMEGSAAAHVAALYNIPFLEIRAGSNYVGQRDKSKWNMPLAAERSSLAVTALIKNASRLLEQWKQ